MMMVRGELVDHLLGDGLGGGEMADHGHSQANGDVDANSPCGGEMVDSGHGHGDGDELPMGMV